MSTTTLCGSGMREWWWLRIEERDARRHEYLVPRKKRFEDAQQRQFILVLRQADLHAQH